MFHYNLVQKSFFLVGIIFFVYNIPAISQNLLDWEKKDIIKYIDRSYSSGKKNKINYIKYTNTGSDFTETYFFNKENNCVKYSVSDNIKNLDFYRNKLNEDYYKISDNIWKYSAKEFISIAYLFYNKNNLTIDHILKKPDNIKYFYNSDYMQNYLHCHKDFVIQEIGEPRSILVSELDSASYISYNKDSIKYLYYFNEDNTCKSYNILEKYENYNSRVKNLNSSFISINDSLWLVDTYVIRIIMLKDSFLIDIQIDSDFDLFK